MLQMVPPGQSSSQPLPSRELALFRKVVVSFLFTKLSIVLARENTKDHNETFNMRSFLKRFFFHLAAKKEKVSAQLTDLDTRSSL